MYQNNNKIRLKSSSKMNDTHSKPKYGHIYVPTSQNNLPLKLVCEDIDDGSKSKTKSVCCDVCKFQTAYIIYMSTLWVTDEPSKIHNHIDNELKYSIIDIWHFDIVHYENAIGNCDRKCTFSMAMWLCCWLIEVHNVKLICLFCLIPN